MSVFCTHMARTLADLAPPAVGMGVPFILLYAARSVLIAIYFVLTCSCLHILVLMYLTCSSHDRPLFLVYKVHSVCQNKTLSFDCHSCPSVSLHRLPLRVLSSSTRSVEVSTPLDFFPRHSFPRHFSLRSRALAASSSFYQRVPCHNIFAERVVFLKDIVTMVGKADTVVREAAKVKDNVVYCAVGELHK
jgi:hypothetical protein